ncbi:MAG: NUDIX hydrolase [Deltaproteobacteria bacterium]|nr:NUDIX hydrolase [Deltaproteobacteria bacterium]
MRSSVLQSIHHVLMKWNPSTERLERFKSQFLSYKEEDFCSRLHTVPGHFTASGFVRTYDFAYICLIFHPRFKKWIQPGGHLELGDEDILEAAKREVLEETGLSNITWDGTIRLDVHDVPTTSKQEGHLHFDVQFGFIAPFVPLSGDIRADWIAYDSFDKSKSDDSVNRFLENWR